MCRIGQGKKSKIANHKETQEFVVTSMAQQCQSFEEMGLCPELIKAVTKMGWKKPMPIQASTFQKAMNGEAIAGQAETGSGKTGAYLLPILQRIITSKAENKFAVILAPSRELVLQIADVLQIMTEGLNITYSTCYGGVDDVEQMLELSQNPHIIIATPGRLATLIRNAPSFNLHGVQVVVVDEADKMANATFFDDIREIVSSSSYQRQLLLFSATMPNSVEKLKLLSVDQTQLVKLADKQSVPQSLKELLLVHSPFRGEIALVDLVDSNPGQQIIVFVNKMADTQIIGDLLINLGFSVSICHGGMDQPERDEAMRQFRESETRIIVASQAIARGIDCNVDLVINYDIPDKNEDYIHRAGRAGRAGRDGQAITFASRDTQAKFAKLERFLKRKLNTFKYNEKEAVSRWEEKVAEAKEAAVDKYKASSRQQHRT